MYSVVMTDLLGIFVMLRLTAVAPKHPRIAHECPAMTVAFLRQASKVT